MIRRLASLLTLVALGCASGLAHAEPAHPKRIVSLNMCVDAILVELVAHDRIAALSHYARDPQRSTIAEIAQHLPITYETAEEVVALRPDLVLTSRHSAPATRNALRRVGIRFELFDVPSTIAGSSVIAVITSSTCSGRLSASSPRSFWGRRACGNW